MRIKVGVGAKAQKDCHQDRKRNVEYFKETYLEGNPSKHPDVKCNAETDNNICWITFQSPLPVYCMGYPIGTNQGYYDFIGECKKAFLSINDWAWKEIKTLQDYESKQRKKEEKI